MAETNEGSQRYYNVKVHAQASKTKVALAFEKPFEEAIRLLVESAKDGMIERGDVETVLPNISDNYRNTVAQSVTEVFDALDAQQAEAEQEEI